MWIGVSHWISHQLAAGQVEDILIRILFLLSGCICTQLQTFNYATYSTNSNENQ